MRSARHAHIERERERESLPYAFSIHTYIHFFFVYSLSEYFFIVLYSITVFHLYCVALSNILIQGDESIRNFLSHQLRTPKHMAFRVCIFLFFSKKKEQTRKINATMRIVLRTSHEIVGPLSPALCTISTQLLHSCLPPYLYTLFSAFHKRWPDL